MSGDFDSNEMKTREDVELFLASVEREIDDQGEKAEIAIEDFLKIEAYKASLDLGSIASEFKGASRTVSPVTSEVHTLDWNVAFEGVGLANFRMHEPDDAEYVSFWASIYLDNEPYWINNDPYECSWDQIGVIFNRMPTSEQTAIFDLLSKNPEQEGFLRKAAGLPIPANGGDGPAL